MNTPDKPKLPEHAPDRPPATQPHPLRRPDERKEGGPDFGKTEKQQQNREKAREDADNEAVKP